VGVYIRRDSNALGEAVTTASMKIRSKLVNCIHKVTTVTTHCYTLQAKKLCGGKIFVMDLMRCTDVKDEIVWEWGAENDVLSAAELTGEGRKLYNDEHLDRHL